MNKSNEIFTIDIDSEENKSEINEFKKLIIDQKIGAVIVYRNYEYKIHSIMKKKV